MSQNNFLLIARPNYLLHLITSCQEWWVTLDAVWIHRESTLFRYSMCSCMLLPECWGFGSQYQHSPGRGSFWGLEQKVWILPRAQAEVGHLWSDAGSTCAGGNLNPPNYSGPDSAHSGGYGHGYLWKFSEIVYAKNKQDCKISSNLHESILTCICQTLMLMG